MKQTVRTRAAILILRTRTAALRTAILRIADKIVLPRTASQIAETAAIPARIRAAIPILRTEAKMRQETAQEKEAPTVPVMPETQEIPIPPVMPIPTTPDELPQLTVVHETIASIMNG